MKFKTIRQTFFFILLCLVFPALSAAKSGGSWTPATPLASLDLHIPIAGNWSTSPGDEIGYFRSDLGIFYLCTVRGSIGPLPCVAYQAHDGRRGWPLIGRWEPGDTRDRPAIYDHRSGWLHIYDYSDCLPDLCAGFGGLRLRASHHLGAVGAIPVVGDWDASGVDSIALLSPQLTAAGESTRYLAILFSDGFTHRASQFEVPFDVSLFSVISGNWPGSQHVGDSLGFHKENGGSLLLFDDSQSFQNVTLSHPGIGRIAFSGNWNLSQDSFAFYMPPPPACQSTSHCHRVDLMELPSNGTGGPLVPAPVEDPNPLIDSRFPDDPGNPVDPNP